PLRVGAYLPIRLGPGQLEPGVGLDAEAIAIGFQDVVRSTHLESATLCAGQVCVSPGADVSLGWAYRSARHLYARALGRAGIGVPYGFASDADGQIWSTARTYLEVGIEFGVWFQ